MNFKADAILSKRIDDLETQALALSGAMHRLEVDLQTLAHILAPLVAKYASKDDRARLGALLISMVRE